jgi:hypothetical protein
MPKIIINIYNACSSNPCPHIYMVLSPEKIEAAEQYHDDYNTYDETSLDTHEEHSGIMSTSEGVYIMHFVGAMLKEDGEYAVRSVILPEISGKALEALHAVWLDELRQYEVQYNGSTILQFSESAEKFHSEDTLEFLDRAAWSKQVDVAGVADDHNQVEYFS